jgi:hypothetical protein
MAAGSFICTVNGEQRLVKYTRENASFPKVAMCRKAGGLCAFGKKGKMDLIGEFLELVHPSRNANADPF